MDGNIKRTKRSAISVALLGFIAAAFIVTAVLSTPARADIYRGCTGFIGIAVTGGLGVDSSRGTTKTLDEFEGRGQCANKTQANTCRKRAMDNVFRCANDLWAIRWNLIGDPNDGHADMGLPLSCQGRATGAKGLGPFHENPFGKFFDIKHAIEYAACCQLQPTASSLNVGVFVSTVGDRGCGKNATGYGSYSEQRTLEGNYVADCESLRAQGMCAVRTN
jgi:hypothetical protein